MSEEQLQPLDQAKSNEQSSTGTAKPAHSLAPDSYAATKASAKATWEKLRARSEELSDQGQRRLREAEIKGEHAFQSVVEGTKQVYESAAQSASDTARQLTNHVSDGVLAPVDRP